MKRKVFVAFLMMVVCMSLFTMHIFASVTDDNPYNVALGKTVTDVNNVAAYGDISTLTDGDGCARATSSERFTISGGKLANAVLEIDLEAQYTLSGVDVLSSGNSYGGKNGTVNTLRVYQIHYLSDEGWLPVKIAGGSDIMGEGGFANENVSVSADGYTVTSKYGGNFLVFGEKVTTNKIRLVSKDTSATAKVIREIRVYKEDGNNVAFRKPVTISWASFGGGSGSTTVQQVPSFVVDGQSNNQKAQEFTFGSKASVSTTDHWVEIDLLKSYNINKAVISTGTTANFKLQAYVNGEYVDIPGASVTGNKAANCELTFPVYTMNKVRLFLPKGQSSQKIKEIKLYAVDDIVVECGYTKDGESVECLADNAILDGSMKVTNNTASLKNATFISALYETVNGTELLKDVKIDSKEIAGSGTTEVLKTTMTLPAGVDNCTLRTYLFDTLDNITPYFDENNFPVLEKDNLQVELVSISDNQMLPDTATVEVKASYGTKAVSDVELYLDDTILELQYANGVYSAGLPDGIALSEHTLYATAKGEDDTTKRTETFNVNVYDASKIVVKQSNNNIDFYIKGSNENSNRYIKHILRRQTVAPTQTDAGVDLWRLFGSYDVERIGEYEFKDTYDSAFVTHGVEWECALEIVDKDTYIPGKSDTFIGGFHKNEFVDEDTIVVKYDGETADVTKTQNLLVDKIELAEVSNIHVGWPVSGDVAAEHSKQYEITKDGGIKVVQGLDWKKEIELKCAYLTMLPIHRQLPGGIQITDRAMRDDNGNGLFDDTVYDVTYGNNTSIGIAKGTNNIFASKIWGEESGISAEVRVDYNPIIETNDFFVSMYTQNDGYNKLYFDYCDKYTPKAGDKWFVATTFKFDISK